MSNQEIKPFTKEDFEAAIEASGWDNDEVDNFFITNEQHKLSLKCGGLLSPCNRCLFVYDGPIVEIAKSDDQIIVQHCNGDRFTWTRPTDQPFKVGDRVQFTGDIASEIGVIESIGVDNAIWVKWGIIDKLYPYSARTLKHAPVEQEQETKPEPPKPKEPEFEYTHSVELVSRWGDLITIPEPDSSWEMIEEKRDRIDLWPSLHVGNFGKRTIIVRTAFDSGATKETNLKVIHKDGMMCLSEYVVRARQEAMRILSYKKFRRPIDNDPIVEIVETYSGAQTLKTLAKEPVSECEWPKGSRPERKYVK